MELRDIEYFAVVAEQGHLGRAAEALDLTQSALSKSLRRLERTLEAKLVQRTPTGVKLTVEGSALLARVQGLRLSLRDAAREIAELSQGRVGSLRIGLGPGVDERLVTSACAVLLNDALKVVLHIHPGDDDIFVPALRNGELDVVLNFLPPTPREGLAQECLHEVVNVVCARADHRLASRGKLKVADLAGERWALTSPGLGARQWLIQKLLDCGIPQPIMALETRSIRPRLQILAGSNLLGFLPRHILQQAAPSYRLTELPLEELVLYRRAGVVHRSDGYLSPTARRFIETLKSLAPNSRTYVTPA